MLLLASIALSVIIWTFLFNLKFTIVLIVAIFIHEYGHFYWMGKEGIKNKDMVFIPPFGAVARTKEYWPSYGAELRIALAGPVFGLLSVALFWTLYLIYPKDIFLASVGIACIINLFNLALPIPILDGGRVIKSILYSINQLLGDAFYIFGFIFIIFAFLSGYLSTPILLLIGYILYSEWNYVKHSRHALAIMNSRKTFLENHGADLKVFGQNTEALIGFSKKEFSKLDAIVNLKRMNIEEMILGASTFLILIVSYILILYCLSMYIDISMAGIQSYFK
ncbi:MAG: hypothetical protein HYT62_02815 [Candidatus Yanofskybacteria bacterium]|nr:hypothetical protein [Candidatus Yanofskybacteria bacterium]